MHFCLLAGMLLLNECILLLKIEMFLTESLRVRVTLEWSWNRIKGIVTLNEEE